MHKAKEDYRRGIIADKYHEVQEQTPSKHVWCGDGAIHDYYQRIDSEKGGEEIVDETMPEMQEDNSLRDGLLRRVQANGGGASGAEQKHQSEALLCEEGQAVKGIL